jgi:hypothetical protein
MPRNESGSLVHSGGAAGAGIAGDALIGFEETSALPRLAEPEGLGYASEELQG